MKVCRLCYHDLTTKELAGYSHDNCDKCDRVQLIVYDKICPECNDTKYIQGRLTTFLTWLDTQLGTDFKQRQKCPCPLQK